MPEIWQDAAVREIVARLHHEGCGGRPKLVGLVSGIDGSNGGRPVRRIALMRAQFDRKKPPSRSKGGS